MRAGALSHTIAIQSPFVNRSSLGAEIVTWTTTTTTKAEIVPLSGREFFSAQQINDQITTRIRCRFVAGVTAKMRVLCGSTSYDIVFPNNVDGLNRELEMLCTAGTRHG